MARRLLPVLADAVIAAADIIREHRSRTRAPAPKTSMALTDHERRCVLRYRGRGVLNGLRVPR